MNKLGEADRAAENLMAQYRNMKSEIASALAAVGPVSEGGDDSPSFGIPFTPGR